MKKLLMLLVAAAVVSIPSFAQNGNQAPSGPHYDLNIIGVDKAKTQPLTTGDRHTIFVPLETSSLDGPDTDLVAGHEIWLFQGTPFEVCDGNAFDVAYNCSGNTFYVPGTTTDALGASFQLPCDTLITAAAGTTLVPCDTTAGSASYTVWARVVGTPGGSATITTCAYDSTNTLVCSLNEKTLVRMKPNWFANLTDVLTSIVTKTQTLQLFAQGYQGFFWDYDNNGNKVLQLRFYLAK